MICYGWYINNIKNGNFWQINLKKMCFMTKITGYYENDLKVGEIRTDSLEYPLCDINRIFFRQ